MQWGFKVNPYYGGDENRFVDITFPIPFPHKCIIFESTLNARDNDMDKNMDIVLKGSLSKTKVTAGIDQYGIYWLALGY